jgi:hypothetical protein
MSYDPLAQGHIIPQPTNAERDAQFFMYGRRDRDSRWNKYPGVRVAITGFAFSDDPEAVINEGEELHGKWAFHATLDDGRFFRGEDYITPDMARAEAERMIIQGAWTPAPVQYARIRRSEIVGPIGQPDPELAQWLQKWEDQDEN